jgi:hypothetical protein
MSATNVKAVDFTIDSPEEVELEQEFIVHIDASEEETYDVKAFVYSTKKTNYISQIYKDDEWKSPHYFLLGIYPSVKDFRLKIIENAENPELCVKLRVPNGQPSEVCKSISIIGNNNPVQETIENEPDPEPVPNKIEDKENFSSVVATKEIIETNSSNKKIKLSYQNSEFNEEITPAYKSRVGIIYLFVGLCVLLVVLMALRKL